MEKHNHLKLWLSMNSNDEHNKQLMTAIGNGCIDGQFYFTDQRLVSVLGLLITIIGNAVLDSLALI